MTSRITDNLRILLVLALSAFLLALATPPAAATTAPFPYDLSITGGYGIAEVVVPLPEGTTPTRLTGRITSDYTAAGQLQVLVDSRPAAEVPAPDGGSINIALRAADVVDGGVVISLRADLDPSPDCYQDDHAVASLVDARIVLDRAPNTPTTIAGFLAPGAPSYLVAVPAAPTAAEQQAGLDAVLALEHVVGDKTDIELVVTDEPPPTNPARRTVTVAEEEASNNGLAVTDGRLLVTGAGESLSAAAISLADPNTGLLAVDAVRGLSGTADYAPLTGPASLDQLGVTTLTVRGIGRVSQVVTVPQAAFGAPISQVIVDLRGAATPVLPGQQGRVSVRWNDALVSSQALTQDPRVGLSFTVGTEDLRAVNYLTLEFEYLPAGGDCSNPPLPGQVQIDVAASRATPTFGTSAGPGFQRFPQSFGEVIPVAVAGPVSQSLPHAAALLTAAVAPSPLQYTARLTQVDDLADGGGLATGVDPAQAQLLAAPLPDEQDSGDFPAGVTTAYAALQAFQSGGSDVILLSAEPGAAAATLAAWPAAQDGGWSALEGQVYVDSATIAQPQAFAAASTEPDKQTPQLVAAAIASGVLLLVLGIWLWRRPRRR